MSKESQEKKNQLFTKLLLNKICIVNRVNDFQKRKQNSHLTLLQFYTICFSKFTVSKAYYISNSYFEIESNFQS